MVWQLNVRFSLIWHLNVKFVRIWRINVLTFISLITEYVRQHQYIKIYLILYILSFQYTRYAIEKPTHYRILLKFKRCSFIPPAILPPISALNTGQESPNTYITLKAPEKHSASVAFGSHIIYIQYKIRPAMDIGDGDLLKHVASLAFCQIIDRVVLVRSSKDVCEFYEF